MNWIRNLLRRWLTQPDRAEVTKSSVYAVEDSQSGFTLTVMNAINGKVIHIRTYQPQRNGPDWKTEYYIVPDGEKLTDAVAILLMAKNLETA